MPTKRYVVTLTSTEREQLEALVRSGRRPARSLTRARIRLQTDQGRTVERIRERFVTDGLDAALAHKKPVDPPREPVLDGAAEARLIALACSATPDGRKAWTLRMLADKMVELEVVEAVSHETVRRALKKTR
jgi:hypothetical protein